jgi:hypothetical protein
MSETQQAESGGSDAAYTSKLSEGRQRFLAYVIEHGLEIGRRTHADFIRHFPPSAIMDGLKNQPRLRAAILVLTTGVKQKIAVKKSAASAADDLQIALDEGETDAESIVTLFNPDDRVRFLDERKLWAYVVEGDFWNTSPSKKEDFERAKEHVAFMLDRALTDKLVTHRDVVDGVTVDELVTRLPKAELGKIITAALEHGHRDTPFKDENLIAATPSATLVRFIPLSHIYKTVIEPKIAASHGYVEGDVVSAAPAQYEDPLKWDGMSEMPPSDDADAADDPATSRPAPAGNGTTHDRSVS